MNQGPAVVAESKSFTLVEDGILYNAVLNAGNNGFDIIFVRSGPPHPCTMLYLVAMLIGG